MGPDTKIRVAVVLGLVALALGLAYAIVPARLAGARGAGVQDTDRIRTVLRELYPKYGIDPATVKTRRIAAAGKPVGRIEERVQVRAGFLSLLFHHQLHHRVSAFGAHVVATEKTREDAVTMHIVKNGVTLESVVFGVER
jgi:hypothetical protein